MVETVNVTPRSKMTTSRIFDEHKHYGHKNSLLVKGYGPFLSDLDLTKL